MEIERRRIVADRKWGHPEIVDDGGWNTPGIDSIAAFGSLTKTSEEQDAAQKESLKVFAPMLDSMNWEETYDRVVAYTDHGCPEEPDAKPVRVIALMPKDIKEKEKLPVAIGISGGGLHELGVAEMGLFPLLLMTKSLGERFILFAFDYRLAPGYKYPTAINDCHSAYMWMLEHADELHINTDKIVFNGHSTGGHMALASAFRLKRYNWCGGPMPRGLVVCAPVMTDVAFTESFTYSWTDEEGRVTNWAPETSILSSKLWLGDQFADPSLPPEAYPSRATLEDVKGYPPVWFAQVPELDPNRDSCYALASLLHKAGVFCDIHVWGGTSHMSINSVSGTTGMFNKQMYIINNAIKDAYQFDLRREWLWNEVK